MNVFIRAMVRFFSYSHKHSLFACILLLGTYLIDGFENVGFTTITGISHESTKSFTGYLYVFLTDITACQMCTQQIR